MVEDEGRDVALRAAAEVVIDRLDALARTMDETERAVLAALLAPVLREDEVLGFDADGARPLPPDIADAVHERRIRVVDR